MYFHIIAVLLLSLEHLQMCEILHGMAILAKKYSQNTISNCVFFKSNFLLFSFCLCGKAKINLFYSGLDPETQQWVERVDNYLLFNSTNLHFKYFIYVLLLRAYQLVCKGQEQGSAE